jgi:hypothetical protein
MVAEDDTSTGPDPGVVAKLRSGVSALRASDPTNGTGLPANVREISRHALKRQARVMPWPGCFDSTGGGASAPTRWEYNQNVRVEAERNSKKTPSLGSPVHTSSLTALKEVWEARTRRSYVRRSLRELGVTTTTAYPTASSMA